MEWCRKKNSWKMSCWLRLCSKTEFAQNLLQIIITSSFLYIYFIAHYFNLCIKFNLLWLHASCLNLRKLFAQIFVYDWAQIVFWIFDCKFSENLKLKIMLFYSVLSFLFSFVYFTQFCLFYLVLSFSFSFVFFIQFCLFYLVLPFLFSFVFFI